MIENLNEILKDKGYSDSDLISRIFKDLNELDVISIRRCSCSTFPSILRKTSKNPAKLEIYKKIINDYFASLSGEESLIFPNFNYLVICYKLGLKEPPRCCCGKVVNIMGKIHRGGSSSLGMNFNRTCGNPECQKKYIKTHSLEKYGTNHPTQNESVKDKVKQTLIEKYGTPNITGLTEIRNKREKTCLEKYGFKHASSSQAVKDKVRASNIKSGFWTETSGKIKKVYEKTPEAKAKSRLRQKLKVEEVRKGKSERYLKELREYLETKGFVSADDVYRDAENLVKNCRAAIRTHKDSFSLFPLGGKDKAEEFLKGNNSKFTWDELNTCLVTGRKSVPLCKYCGNKLSISKCHSDFNKSCGSKECSKKASEDTCLEKYGNRYPCKTEEVKERTKSTNLKKYGSVCPMNNPDVKETARKNQMEKYGVANISQLQYIKDKKEKTFMEHYGYKCGLMAPEIKERIKNTNLERYGYENAFSSPEIIRKSRRKYFYKEMYFDSSWELAFYIYCEDHNILIRRSPDPIPYEVDGHRHSYFPDFAVDNQYIEIKGDHLIDDNGNLLFHPAVVKLLEKVDDDTRKEYEKILSAKSELLRNLNVKILKEENIKEYMSYIKNRYGKSYIKKFRSKK